jgi:alpha-tubulin suppressor-like RCC1 family protein
MNFTHEPLPKRVEMLYDTNVFAVGVAAGAKHTLVADADGAVWGFGYLNALGAWNDPTVKAMRNCEDGSADGDSGLFGDPSWCSELVTELDCFNFLFPRGRASISMPVRVPVNVRGHSSHSERQLPAYQS